MPERLKYSHYHVLRSMKKLYRSKNNRMLFGVCGGIAEYFNVDPVIVRLIWAFFTLGSGLFPGIITYAIAWLIIPDEPTEANA